MDRMNLLLLCGGQSEEHDISLLSAATILGHLDRNKYDIRVVGITKSGRWLLTDEAALKDGSWEKSQDHAVLLPDASRRSLMITRGEDPAEFWPVDLVFPVLHGRFGEDGTVQGLCELARIPYVGCGVAASAVSMDKIYTKVLAHAAGAVQAPYVALDRTECTDPDRGAEKIEKKLKYPLFVKPSDGGSSQGVSCVKNRDELPAALDLAARYGTRVLVEEQIFGRELECAVLSTPEGPRASGVGEIVAAAEFYDFEAKYQNPDSVTDVAPKLPEGKQEEIREMAVRIFRAVGAKGLARVDFFLEQDSHRVIFNEINTFPGFTSISMYPMLWQAAGLPLPKLLDALIEDAFSNVSYS